MDIRIYQMSILFISLFPLSVTGQEWSKQDSLKLQQILQSDQEIKINKKAIEEIKQNLYHPHPEHFVGFDSTLPTIKRPLSWTSPHISGNLFHIQTSSIFSPTFSRIKIDKNLILQSKNNFSESSNHFHIQTQMEYKLSGKWSFSIYGSHNLDIQRYRGLPSEVIPTALGSDIVFKLNKRLKIKTGIQYQYNTIRRKWEWIPQSCISYEW